MDQGSCLTYPLPMDQGSCLTYCFPMANWCCLTCSLPMDQWCCLAYCLPMDQGSCLTFSLPIDLCCCRTLFLPIQHWNMYFFMDQLCCHILLPISRLGSGLWDGEMRQLLTVYTKKDNIYEIKWFHTSKLFLILNDSVFWHIINKSDQI